MPLTEAGKYNHGKFPADGTTHSIPAPLALAFERLILSRQLLGEENDFIFGKNLLLSLIQIWNENIVQLRADYIEKMGSKALQELDATNNAEDEREQERFSQRAMSALKESLNELKTIVIEKTPAALKILDLQLAKFSCKNMFINMGIYIYYIYCLYM